MSMQEVIFLLLGIVIIILVGIIALLVYRFNKTNKKIKELLEKGKIKDFKEMLLAQKEKGVELDKEIKKALLRIKNLEEISEYAVQKTSVVRFNPFGDMGGDQSFVIALLDKRNNGFLISSFFAKEGNRVYSKLVKEGKSSVALSKEEIEALDKAIDSSDPK